LHAGSEEHLIGVYGWTEYYGIPLPFYTIAFLPGYGLYSELNTFFLAIDIFLWYLLSCLIVRIYDSCLPKINLLKLDWKRNLILLALLYFSHSIYLPIWVQPVSETEYGGFPLPYHVKVCGVEANPLPFSSFNLEAPIKNSLLGLFLNAVLLYLVSSFVLFPFDKTKMKLKPGCKKALDYISLLALLALLFLLSASLFTF